MVEEQGIESINARDLAKNANISTKPIYRIYTSLDDLKNDVNEIIKKDYSWLGDVEAECKQILNNRKLLIQNKTAASKLASLYSLIFDFEKQLALLNNRLSLTRWLEDVKLQITRNMELNDNEINELVGVLIFHRRTVNNGALKLYSEYQKLITAK